MSSKQKSNVTSLTKTQLLSESRIFAQHIVIAIDCLDQSCAMDKIFTDSKHAAEFKAAPYFYRTAYHAMRFRFELEVNKLFDQESRSFDSFKNDLSNYEKNSQQEAASFTNGLSSGKRILQQKAVSFKLAYKLAENDINVIRNRRNKIHAHSDANCFNDPDLFSEAHPFNRENIRKLLLSMLDLCNAVILCYTEEGIAQLHGIGNSDDFVKLFGYETTFKKQCDDILEEWVTRHDQL